MQINIKRISIPKVGSIAARECHAKVFGPGHSLYPVYVEENGPARLVVVRAVNFDHHALAGDIIVDNVPASDAETCLAASAFFHPGSIDWASESMDEQRTDEPAPEQQVRFLIKMNTQRLLQKMSAFEGIEPAGINGLAGVLDNLYEVLTAGWNNDRDDTLLFASWSKGELEVTKRWSHPLMESYKKLQLDQLQDHFRSLRSVANHAFAEMLQRSAFELVIALLSKHVDYLHVVPYTSKIVSDHSYYFPDPCKCGGHAI